MGVRGRACGGEDLAGWGLSRKGLVARRRKLCDRPHAVESLAASFPSMWVALDLDNECWGQALGS